MSHLFQGVPLQNAIPGLSFYYSTASFLCQNNSCVICLERLAQFLLSCQALPVGPAVQLHVGLEFFILLDSNVYVWDRGAFCMQTHALAVHTLMLPVRTRSLDTVAEVVCKVVNNVQQEGEVGYIVHMNVVWV